MIYLNLRIENPWSERWDTIWARSGRLTRHKAWEVQVCRGATIFEFLFRYNIRQDHAGLRLQLALLSYDFKFNIYDTRHWNYNTNSWETYDEQNTN